MKTKTVEPAMMVSREELLRSLELVQAGLSTKGEVIEQSNRFVFKDGRVMAFNGEVMCSTKSPVDITGAVMAESLLKLLREIAEEQIGLTQEKGKLWLIGKRWRSDFLMDAEITLPTDSVEAESKWRKLPEDFGEAIGIVQQCAGKDESQWALTCVHVHPQMIEASDDHQLARYEIGMPIKEAFLVRTEAIKHISALGMTGISEAPNWIHFRNSSGLVFSCRRYLEEFPDTSPMLEVKGSKLTLLKGLTDTLTRAGIFSSENDDGDLVTVELSEGKIRVRARGKSGGYYQFRHIKYTGKPFAFRISPELLSEIIQRHSDCVISKERLKVESGKLSYVCCLVTVEKET